MSDIDIESLLGIEEEGKVLAVCSSKGGVGTTSIAVNLAIALSKRSANVALVDGNFQFGNVALSLNINPSISIHNLQQEITQLDEYSIMNYLIGDESGIHFLAAPDRPEYAELITDEVIDKTLIYLKKKFDYIIVDVGNCVDQVALKVYDHAFKILPVTTMEIGSLKNMKSFLDILERLEFAEKVGLIINRYNMDSIVKVEEVKKLFQVNETYYIPNNIKLMQQALNIGKPIVSGHTKSDVAKGIFKMAQSLSEKSTYKIPRKKKGLAKLFSK